MTAREKVSQRVRAADEAASDVPSIDFEATPFVRGNPYSGGDTSVLEAVLTLTAAREPVPVADVLQCFNERGDAAVLGELQRLARDGRLDLGATAGPGLRHVVSVRLGELLAALVEAIDGNAP